MPKTKQHQEFADRLARAMADCGWTGRGRAERLAEALRAGGLEKATSQLVSTWLRGERMPRGAYADRLPRVLGIQSGWLSGADVPDTGPASPQVERSGRRGRRGEGSGGRSRTGVISESVRGYEQQEAVWRGFRVLANRIARTIQQTIAGNELGYSVTSRAMLADALEVFARDLDRRCGEKVCGDIWEMVAWLRKPSEG